MFAAAEVQSVDGSQPVIAGQDLVSAVGRRRAPGPGRAGGVRDDASVARRQVRVEGLLAQLGVTTLAAERQRIAADIVVVHRAVARSVAARYRGRGVDREDLEQLACLGLMKAALRWQPGRCENFLQFAVPTMTGEIKRYFRDHSLIVRPPRGIQDVRHRMTSLDDSLQALPDRELAGHLELPVARVREARQAVGLCRPASIDQLDPDGRTLGDRIGVDDENIGRLENRLCVEALLEGLAPRPREIVRLRYFENLSQSEIGQRLGVSQMQISRRLRAILNDLHTKIAA